MFATLLRAGLTAAVALGLTAGTAAAGPYDYYAPVQPVGYYEDGFYDADCRRRNEGEEIAATLFGAIIGGVIGGQFGGGSGEQTAAAIAGALIGGFAGNRLTRNLRCDDYYFADDAYYQGFEGYPGQTYNWQNPNSGNYGSVQPIGNYYQYQNYRQCRQFSQTIYIDGRRQAATGVACRRPDGTWQIVQ